MVTTRRNVDDGTAVNEAEKGGPSQAAPPVQPNDEFNEAEYDEGYNEEEGYDYPMNEETLEVELLRQQMADQQRAMEAQAANMAAMQEMMRSMKAAMDAMTKGAQGENPEGPADGFMGPSSEAPAVPEGGPEQPEDRPKKSAQGPADKGPLGGRNPAGP